MFTYQKHMMKRERATDEEIDIRYDLPFPLKIPLNCNHYEID